MAEFQEIKNDSDRVVTFLNRAFPETSRVVGAGDTLKLSATIPNDPPIVLQTKIGSMAIFSSAENEICGTWEFDTPERAQALASKDGRLVIWVRPDGSVVVKGA